MKDHILPAVIIALGLIVGGFLAGGRYSIVAIDNSTVARLDRLTGTVSMCVPGTQAECEWFFENSNSVAQNSN
jgi:hypothetical protein